MRTSGFAARHITGEGLRTLKVYRHFYKAAIRQIEAWEQAYDAEVAAWYETGDGRPTSEGGRGHTFPHCIHGSSRWTDYDNICGGCEDSATKLQSAQEIAREGFLRFNDRFEWLQSAPGDLPHDIRRTITDWAFQAFPKGTE